VNEQTVVPRWVLGSLDKNQIRLLRESLFDDLGHLIDSEADMTLMILNDIVRVNSTSKCFRISAVVTYIVVHGPSFLTPDHINLPARIAQLLPQPFPIPIPIFRLISLGNRSPKRQNAQHKRFGAACLNRSDIGTFAIRRRTQIIRQR